MAIRRLIWADWASCCEDSRINSSCSAVISKPIPANGPSQLSPIPSLNCGGQSQPGKRSCKLAKTQGEITPRVASSACLLFSMPTRWLASSVLRRLDNSTLSLLSSETLAVEMSNSVLGSTLVHYCIILTPPLRVLNLLETQSHVLTITWTQRMCFSTTNDKCALSDCAKFSCISIWLC